MMTGVFQSLVTASFGWFLASSLWIYPHSLSYFNESIGGPLNGLKHLFCSNAIAHHFRTAVGRFVDVRYSCFAATVVAACTAVVGCNELASVEFLGPQPKTVST